MQYRCLPRHAHGQERLPAQPAQVTIRRSISGSCTRDRHSPHQPIRPRGKLDPAQGDRPDPSRGREDGWGPRAPVTASSATGWPRAPRLIPLTIPRWSDWSLRPRSRMLEDAASEQQLVVRAQYADGSTRDVTRLARYGSTDTAVASVDDEGHVVKRRRGRDDHPGLFRASRRHQPASSSGNRCRGWTGSMPPQNNFIDEHVFAKLKLLHIPPSELSDDASSAAASSST